MPWPERGPIGASQWVQNSAKKPGQVKPPTKPTQAPGVVRPAVTPGSIKPVAPANPATVAQKSTYKVTTASRTKGAEVQILLGTYVEQGINHGKKTYKKVEAIPGHPGVKVFLYFWDARDGRDFAGWWFGNEIGGAQVWAKCPAQTAEVPSSGWLVPWDAPRPEPGLLSVTKVAASASSASGAGAPPPWRTTSPPKRGQAAEQAAGSDEPETPTKSASRVQICKVKMDKVDIDLKKLTAEAKEKIEKADVEGLQAVLPKLQEQQKDQTEVQKSIALELAAVRKGGTACQTSATALLEQIKAMNNLMTQVKTMITGVAAKIPKPKTKEEIEREVKDKADFDKNLPAVRESVTGVTAGLDVTVKMANKMIEEEPPAGVALDASLEMIENAAKESQTKISEVRMKINAQMQSSRRYARDIQAPALKEYTALQSQLTEAQKAVNVYKVFKKEFNAQVANKKAIAEIIENFGEVESEVQEVQGMDAVKDSKASAEDTKAAEDAIKPVMQKVAQQLNAARVKFGGTPALKKDLQLLTERATKAKDTLEAAQKKLKPRLEKIAAAKTIERIQEALRRAEEALQKCSEMELPWLKGIEVGHGDESKKALAACDQAAAQAQGALGQTLGLINNALAASGQFEDKDLGKETKAETTKLQETMHGLKQKLEEFRSSTVDRKAAAAVFEATDLMAKANAKVALYSEAAAVFLKEGGAASESLETLKTALEKSNAADVVCTAACMEARKCLQGKQVPKKESGPATELEKLKKQLETAQQDMGKTKKAVTTARTLIMSKEAVSVVEEQMKEMSAVWEKIERLSKDEEATDDAILEMVDCGTKMDALIKSMTLTVKKAIGSAVPALKDQVNTLKEQFEKIKTDYEASKKATKKPRELVLAKVYVDEAKKKAEGVEAAMEKVSAAELPFLKGVETMPLQEAKDSVKLSKEAGDAARAAISAAILYIKEKSKELKTFEKEALEGNQEALDDAMTRISQSSQALAQFFEDVGGREKSVTMQESESMISELDALVAIAGEKAKPFTEGEADAMPEEEATALCEKFMDVEKEAQVKLREVKTFMAKAASDVRGVPEHAEAMKELQTRLKDAGMSLVQSKKATSAREHKITARRVAEELREIVKDMEAENTKVAGVLAPMLEHGGEKFLVQACVRRFAGALQEHMAANKISEEDMLKEVGTESAFVEFVQKMPQALKKEELLFMEGRPAAMFKQIDEDSDGKIDADDLKSLFCPKWVCVKEIAVTDSFDLDKSAATTSRLKPGDIVEAMAAPKVDETGMTRVQCRLPAKDDAEGTTGWVTTKGNSGVIFLRASTSLDTFSVEADASVDASVKVMSAAIMKVKAKNVEFPKATGPVSKDAEADAKEGSVEQLRPEVAKLVQKAFALQQAVASYKSKLKQAKVEFVKKEDRERNAHIFVKEQKQIDELMGPVTDCVALVETSGKTLQEVTAPFLALKEEELHAFSAPASTLKDAERMLAALVEAAADARVKLKEGQSKATEIKSSLIGEAKKTLLQYSSKISSMEVAGSKILAQVRGQCNSIVKTLFGECTEQLRNSASPEALYKELADKDGFIPEEALSKKLQSLGGEMKPEHARLVCHQIGAGGIGKFAFMKFLQRYYSVSKTTVITEELDIETTKIVRKLDAGEIIEVTDGPQEDAKAGLMRVRGRALRDSAVGWVSLKGNRGGVFLAEAEKPTYVCVKDMPVDEDVKGMDGEVCSLKSGEVIELLEGPRREKVAMPTVARGKALKDNAIGWVHVKSRQGKTMLEEGKYFTCTNSVDLTDDIDVKEGKVLRKIAAGEIVAALSDPQETGDFTCMRVRSAKDSQEGWVALKMDGKTKTCFTESKKCYTVLESMPLLKASSSTDPIRELESGEAFIVLDGPREEPHDSHMRGKGTVLGRGVDGWFTFGNSLKPWEPSYTCVKAVPLSDSSKGWEGKVIRQLSVGEVIDFLDGPKVDASGAVKIKGSSPKDGAVGWVTVRDPEGTKYLECKSERGGAPMSGTAGAVPLRAVRMSGSQWGASKEADAKA